MNRRSDFVPRLESWLAEDDGSGLSERVLDAVLADLPTTVQSRRRAWRLQEAFRMTPLLRTAIGGVSLLAAGAVLLLIMRGAGSVGQMPLPSGGPSVSPSSSARAISADPCTILTNTQVSKALGKTVSGSVHLSAFDGMRACLYDLRVERSSLAVNLRQIATPTAEARELAKQIFGGDPVGSAVGSAMVFRGCVYPPLCVQAIAVSVAPYFVVFEVPADAPAIDTTPEEVLDALENAVIENLTAR